MAGAEHWGPAVTGTRRTVRWSVNVDRIERARVLNAWTRGRLASAAHIDPKTLTDMCSGRRLPTLATIQAVCSALSLEVADVVEVTIQVL